MAHAVEALEGEEFCVASSFMCVYGCFVCVYYPAGLRG